MGDLEMAEHLLAVTTVGNDDDAEKLARALVESRVAACVNIIGPARSFYQWKGKLEDDRELVLLMKTRTDRFSDLEAVLHEVHPYEVPELIALPIDRGSAAYLAWIDENTG
jgi:periplasmic divalent cation tolerance protein